MAVTYINHEEGTRSSGSRNNQTQSCCGQNFASFTSLLWKVSKICQVDFLSHQQLNAGEWAHLPEVFADIWVFAD